MTFQVFLNNCKLSNDIELKLAAKSVIRIFGSGKHPSEMLKRTYNSDLRDKYAMIEKIEFLKGVYNSSSNQLFSMPIDTELDNDLGGGCRERKTYLNGVAVA